MKTTDEIRKGLALYTPEEVKAILQQKWTIHLQEKLYKSAFAYIQQLEKSLSFARDLADGLKAATVKQEQEIYKLQAERDAAVGRLKQIRDCERCKNYPIPMQNIPCLTCTQSNNCFEWRGVQKEE